MKRLLFIFLLLIIAFSGSFAQVRLWVAMNGDDNNNGEEVSPFATLTKAIRTARNLRRVNDPSVEKGIHIILSKGTYLFYEALFLRPEDAGTKASPTYIEAAPKAHPVISGGTLIKGWKKATEEIMDLPLEANGKVWEADVVSNISHHISFRQLWVNNRKAVRARDNDEEHMQRILAWNHHTGQCWIPTPAIAALENIKEAEFFIHQWWAIASLRIKKIEVHGDSTLLSFYEPERTIQNDHPWPAPWISKETGNSAFYLTNAIQFLNEPGEWYFNAEQQKLYYWPRENENMLSAEVVAPIAETLIRIEGTIDHPVSNIHFKGISFEHTGWLRPSHQGHVPHQVGMYMLDAYKLYQPGTAEKKTLENQAWIGRPTAAITVNYADNISFEQCRFEHMASTAVDYHKAVHRSSVNGNLFKDIGGTAILSGVFSEEGQEIHQSYHPSDERIITSDLSITNNLITNVANEDWGCVGIGAGYVRNTLIEHNELSDLSYTAISVGWGWNPLPNVMKNNFIHANYIHHYGKHNYDCSGIYTLSAQPGTVISENVIDSIYKAKYAHLPSHWFYLYTDEGSSYITLKNNWTPSQKYLQNANGPGNQWINNGPKVVKGVKDAAGIEHEYAYLLKERPTQLHSLPINTEHKELIELVVPQNISFSIHLFKKFLADNKQDSSALYNWKNHYVLFDYVQDISLLQSKIRKAFPAVTIKVYYDLYYTFNRKYCDDQHMAKEWDDILLTADLVADTALQKEYFQYHTTQFEQWPEVAKGFCNANFQQLLGFKNGRQLMLVISIPKGETLDHLNPKTTENNPRMLEWNRRMQKYQQGIEGTAKGEIWVFLKKL